MDWLKKLGFAKKPDNRQPQEVQEEELTHEYSLYRGGYWTDFLEGIEEYSDPIPIETYKRMYEEDSQVKAGVNAIRLPVLAKGWMFKHPVDEAGWDTVKDETEKHIEFLNYVFANMEHDFDDVLEQVMTAIIYGFSVSEPVYKRYLDGEYKGKIGLRKVKTINPLTVKFRMNDYGDVLEVVQEIGDKKIEIPIRKLIHYSFEANFGNPYGLSALHCIHKHWFIKQQMYKFANMAFERQGFPPLVGVVKNKNEKRKMVEMLEGLMFRKGVAISGADDIKVLDTNKTMDFMGYINHQNLMIFRGLLIPSLILGNDGNTAGSYALSSTHFDLYLFRLQSIQRDLEKLVNERLVKSLINLNFGKQKYYPVFQFKPLMDEDKNVLADIFFKLVNAQIVEPTEPFIRDYMGLPQMDEEHKNRVKKEMELKLQMLEQDALQKKLGIQQQEQEQQGQEEEESQVKLNPLSKGTLDMNTHPFNTKGRGDVEKKQ